MGRRPNKEKRSEKSQKRASDGRKIRTQANNKPDNHKAHDCLLITECFCRPNHITHDDGAPNSNSETEKDVATWRMITQSR